MQFSFYIARRYLISKNGKNAINIINILSFVITVVGTAALFIVLSGFSGLKDYSTAFSSYFDPDLKISALNGKSIEVDSVLFNKLQDLSGVTAVSATIEEKAFLHYNEKNEIAYIKGVDHNYTHIINQDSLLIHGGWIDNNDLLVVVGAGLSNQLSLHVNNYGSLLQIMMPKPGKNAINAMNFQDSFRRIDVAPVGIFSVNENIDNKYIYTTINAARTLMGYNQNQATSLELKLKPNVDQEPIILQLKSLFNQPIVIKDKQQLNEGLYKMLQTENLAVYLIFTLILIIALFNVVGSIIMMILDKRNNLKTLLDIGASLSDLRSIFFIQGSLMTIAGGILGLLLGVVFVVVQINFSFIYINAQLPYPFAMQMDNLLVSLGTISVLGLIASYIGSRRINNKLLSS